MVKLIYSDSFDPIVGTGLTIMTDTRDLKKSASTVFDCGYEDIKPDKDHVALHLIAFGDEEAYGPNRNADGFPKHASETYHPTFIKYGHVYEHHKNKDPEKRLGDIVKTAHNTMMSRVELLIHANINKAAHHLTRVEKEGSVPMSMACLTDPMYPILTPLGYVPISKLEVGDSVFTKEGSWKKVKSVNRRVYTGIVSKYYVYGLSFPLEITSDHMMWAKCIEGEKRDRLDTDSVEMSWVHSSHLQQNDRFTYRTIQTVPGYAAIDDVDLAVLMGYYLAEGSLSYNGDVPCSVNFCCNIRDSAVRRIPEICSRVWPEITCRISPHRNSRQAVNIILHSTDVAVFIHRLVGKLCRGKYICPEIFNATKDIKLAFLGGWLDGDGFIDSKGIHWSTASANLVLQGRDLLASIGIPASIYSIDHAKCATSGMPNSGVEYTLNISKFDAGPLMGYASKMDCVLDLPERTKPKSAALSAEDGGVWFLYRIKAIESREVENLQTYNVEVEDDESYSAAGLISHNCSVPSDRCALCNTLRKTVNDPDQCDHVRYSLGKLAENGSLIFVHNDEPKFFDISFVGKPADRTAYGFKVASGFITSTDLAEQEGVIAPELLEYQSADSQAKRVLFKKLANLEKFFQKISGKPQTGEEHYYWELRKAACVSLSDNLIGELRNNTVEVVAPALARRGVIMSFTDFYKYAFGEDYKDLKEHVERAVSLVKSGLFTHLEKTGQASSICNDGYFERGFVVSDIPAATMQKVATALSFTSPTVNDRAIDATLQGRNPKMVFIKYAMDKVISDKVASYLLEKYASYKLSALRVALTNKGVNEDVVAALAVAQDLFN